MLSEHLRAAPGGLRPEARGSHAVVFGGWREVSGQTHITDVPRTSVRIASAFTRFMVPIGAMCPRLWGVADGQEGHRSFGGKPRLDRSHGNK